MRAPLGVSASLTALCLALVLVAPSSAFGEMYEYVDSQGRLHFTQDLGKVPPEYRSQVQRKELRKDISITGERGPLSEADRVRAMEKRFRRLRDAAKRRQREQAPAARRENTNPLANAPEPRKYDKDCSDYYRTKRCRKTLTPAWQRWNLANGGNNGRPDLRRKIGNR